MLFKRTSALLLILAFLAQSFSRYLIVADYYLNTSAYLENCINKDKPELRCNGRCQLCKKLHQENPTDKQGPERRSGEDRNDPISSPAHNNFPLEQPGTALQTYYPDAPEGQPVAMPRTLFHPPGDRLV